MRSISELVFEINVEISEDLLKTAAKDFVLGASKIRGTMDVQLSRAQVLIAAEMGIYPSQLPWQWRSLLMLIFHKATWKLID